MIRFKDKVALVTGGGSGIGLATAIAFAREGAKVVVGNRNEAQGAEVVRTIKAAGGEAAFLRTDVAQEKDVEALVRFAVATYGKIDAAFNNSGIEGALGPTVDATAENFRSVWEINVLGVWLCMKYEIQQMLTQGGGAIVNCSSIAGVIGFPGLSHYVASKHAVMGLTKCAALEYATAGIRVNSVNPAVIATPMSDRLGKSFGMTEEHMAAMHPVGRVGTPDEAASIICCHSSVSATLPTSRATE